MSDFEIRFFSTLKEIAGIKEVRISIGNVREKSSNLVHSVEAVWNEVTRLYPQLSQIGSSVQAAVNLKHVTMDHLVKDEDEIAFFPPVSGG